MESVWRKAVVTPFIIGVVALALLLNSKDVEAYYGTNNILADVETSRLIEEYRAIEKERFKFENSKYSNSFINDILETTDIGHEIKLVTWMVSIAENDVHGYCQYEDKEVGDGIKSTGRELKPDIDCSSFVYYGLLNSGYTIYDLGIKPFTTRTMDEILTGCGFSKLEFIDIDSLMPGDILWREGHTEVYVGEGNTVGAKRAETGSINGKPGDQTGKEVCVKETGVNWEFVYRLED